MHLKKPLAAAIISLSASMAHSVTIDNPGFEDGLNDWIEVDPASTSGVAFSGSGSLKISGSPGRVHQNVDIDRNTNYTLSAYVRGEGEIIIQTGSSNGPGFRSTQFDVSDWTKVELDFNSGSATTTQVGAKYTDSGDVRFDNFELSEAGGSTAPTPTPTPTSPTPTPTPTGNLDRNAPPSDNFDLSEWGLDTPIDFDRDGDSDRIVPEDLQGYEDDFFNTGSDGGMVFTSFVGSPRTSTGTSFPRSELREVIGGDQDAGAGDTEVGPVNWVFSSTSSSVQNRSGGVDGTLRATLAVNHVTTTGDGTHPGRVIIGQIHATENEPCRLYYRKLPGNSRGSIYFVHEEEDGDETRINLIGSESSSQSNPADGIELDEVFSYIIDAEGDDLTVTLIREGKSDIVREFDMSNSGYDQSDQYMYFKAGAYTQNNTGDDDDFDEVTFYLSLIHI